MTPPLLDITKDVCPMTFVKVKMALTRIGPSETLNVILKQEALKNVISSIKGEGHKITKVEGQEGAFLIVVEKAPPGSAPAGA